MNIVLYTHTFLPAIGGRELVTFQLGRALSRRGHKVRVVGPAGFRTARGIDYGFPVHRYPRVSRRQPLTNPNTQRLLETQLLLQLGFDLAFRGGADIVHAHTLYPAGYVASRLRALGVPFGLVMTPHGIDINTAPDRNYGMRLDTQLGPKIDYAINEADAVTAISDGIRDELLNAGGSSAKVHRINNGIDLERFQGPPQSDVRETYGLPANAQLVLTVGNYTPLKGHEDLIRIWPQVLEARPSAYLIIVGANTDHLRELAAQMGVASHVVLTGTIGIPNSGGSDSAPDRLADLYRSSSAYVSASNREGAEGLSLSLLDAMAAGLPLIGTDIVGNRDVIKDGINGYLVPLDAAHRMVTAVCRALEDSPAVAQMRRESLAVSHGYSWDAIAERYEHVYQSVQMSSQLRASSHRTSA